MFAIAKRTCSNDKLSTSWKSDVIYAMARRLAAGSVTKLFAEDTTIGFANNGLRSARLSMLLLHCE